MMIAKFGNLEIDCVEIGDKKFRIGSLRILFSLTSYYIFGDISTIAGQVLMQGYI